MLTEMIFILYILFNIGIAYLDMRIVMQGIKSFPLIHPTI